MTIVTTFMELSCPPHLRPETAPIDSRPIGFLTPTRVPPEKKDKLELLAALDYAITPLFVLGLFGYSTWTGTSIVDAQQEIIIAMGVATTLRTTLFTKRAVSRAQLERKNE